MADLHRIRRAYPPRLAVANDALLGVDTHNRVVESHGLAA
jgi:hypothetical protein